MVLKKPSGRIVAVGDPLVDELKVETATNMYPGRLVKKGTNDDDIVVCDASGKPWSATPPGSPWAGSDGSRPRAPIARKR